MYRFLNEPVDIYHPGPAGVEQFRRGCADVEFFSRGDQLLWTQSRKVRKQTRVEACPDNRIKRRSAFSREFKNSKLLAALKRIISLVLRSREAAEFVETQKERATPEQRETKKFAAVLFYQDVVRHACTTVKPSVPI